MKDKTTNREYIFIWIFGLGMLIVFGAQLLFPNTQANPRETILYNALEIGLSLGFGWILQRIFSRKEFQDSLKQFALSAYRRISDIGKSVIRIRENISQYRPSYPRNKVHELDVIRTIAEEMDDAITSSIADWADIIGEEIRKKEKIEELQQEQIALKEHQTKAQQASKEEIAQKTKILEDINKQIIMLEEALPYQLRIGAHGLQAEEDTFPREGKLNETVIDHYYAEVVSHSCITISIEPFIDITVPEKLTKVVQGRPYAIRIDQHMGGQYGLFCEKDGNTIGEIRNPFTRINSNDYFVSLVALIGSITKTGSIDGPIDVSRSFILMNAEIINLSTPIRNEILVKIPAKEFDFARG